MDFTSHGPAYKSGKEEVGSVSKASCPGCVRLARVTAKVMRISITLNPKPVFSGDVSRLLRSAWRNVRLP